MAEAPILLASKSPRRADLLREAGIAFEVVDVGEVDETPPPGFSPAEVVEHLALRKARAVAALACERTVLTADTLVFLDGETLGKPADADDAVRMLRRLSGRAHEVATGVALATPDGTRSGVDTTRVHFRALADEEIRAYVDTGEPLDKAGSYGIQGGAGAFVAHLEGAADTVIGLPVALVRRLMGI